MMIMTDKIPEFSFLDHTADLRVKIPGNTLIHLFENAGMVLLHLLFRIRSAPAGKTDFLKVSLSGDGLEDLMVRWLSEILYQFEGENLVVLSLKIDVLSSENLKATLKTSPFDPKNYEIQREIKAVTYHQIEVTNKTGLWEATVTFDL